MNSDLTPDTYVIPFGKYKNMKFSDVADIVIIDPKTGEDRFIGLEYLRKFITYNWISKEYRDVARRVVDELDQIMGVTHEQREQEANEKMNKREKKIRKEKEFFLKQVTKNTTILNFDE